MKRKTSVTACGCIIGLLCTSFFIACSSCTNSRGEKENVNSDTTSVQPISTSPVKYNFYIENSGSVKGYFKGNSNGASIILKEFYDRIEENKEKRDTLSLYYINNQIIPKEVTINNWLNQSYSNCNASYSDIDKILEQILSNTNDYTVNIVLSDFCFESSFGSLDRARSEITKIFTKGIKEYNDLSIAIYKYEVSFDGYYYPGGIKYKGIRPIYLWIFGPRRKVKDVANLPITQKEEAKMFLQPTETCIPKVDTNNARMTNKERNIIKVRYWKKDRHGDDLYKVNVKVDMSKIIMSNSDVENIGKYTISPADFYIDNIKHEGNGQFTYTIATERPYKCELKIDYTTDLPNWVTTSNFEGNSMPHDSTTYGIKSLIEGVNNAYLNKSDKIFTFKLNLEE